MILIINLVSGLTYFDLTENERLVNINKEIQLLIFIDLFILIFLRLIMMTASSHKKITGSEDSAGLVANIWMNVNSNSLDYCLVML